MHFNKLTPKQKHLAFIRQKDKLLWDLVDYFNEEERHPVIRIRLKRFSALVARPGSLSGMKKIVEDNPELNQAIDKEALKLARNTFYVPENDTREYLFLSAPSMRTEQKK